MWQYWGVQNSKFVSWGLKFTVGESFLCVPLESSCLCVHAHMSTSMRVCVCDDNLGHHFSAALFVTGTLWPISSRVLLSLSLMPPLLAFRAHASMPSFLHGDQIQLLLESKCFTDWAVSPVFSAFLLSIFKNANMLGSAVYELMHKNIRGSLYLLFSSRTTLILTELNSQEACMKAFVSVFSYHLLRAYCVLSTTRWRSLWP